MIRRMLGVMVSSLLLGCGANGTHTATIAGVSLPGCTPSRLSEVRLVQQSPVFAAAAREVSAALFADSAAAATNVGWLCSQLQLRVPQGIEHLQLVFGPA